MFRARKRHAGWLGVQQFQQGMLLSQASSATGAGPENATALLHAHVRAYYVSMRKQMASARRLAHGRAAEPIPPGVFERHVLDGHQH